MSFSFGPQCELLKCTSQYFQHIRRPVQPQLFIAEYIPVYTHATFCLSIWIVSAYCECYYEHKCTNICLNTCFKDCICLFLERGEGRGRDRERNINVWEIHRSVASRTPPHWGPGLGTWPTTQACALTRNQTGNLSVCRLALNPLSHTSQGSFEYVFSILLRICLGVEFLDYMAIPCLPVWGAATLVSAEAVLLHFSDVGGRRLPYVLANTCYFLGFFCLFCVDF